MKLIQILIVWTTLVLGGCTLIVVDTSEDSCVYIDAKKETVVDTEAEAKLDGGLLP